MAEKGDFREILRYIPQFRNQTFCVLIEADLFAEVAVAEALLDLSVLESLGIKLVLGVLGGTMQELYDWTLESEIRAARTAKTLVDPALSLEVSEILNRGQSALIDISGLNPLDSEIVNLCLTLGVSKIIALTDGGLLVDGVPAFAIRAADVPEVLKRSEIERPDLLEAAAKACEAGVPRIHLLDGRKHGVLVDELFSNEGVGTMVHADSYRAIRPLQEEDIPELLGMIGRVVRRTKLVPRNYEEICSKIHDYYVMTIDSNVVGCVALHPYPASGSAEVACLYVKKSHEGRGYGFELVKYVEKKAAEARIAKLFALTNRAAEFFCRAGYSASSPEELPVQRRLQFETSGRDSEVFQKTLVDEFPLPPPVKFAG